MSWGVKKKVWKLTSQTWPFSSTVTCVLVKTCAQVRVALLLISWAISNFGKEFQMSNIDSFSNPIICSFKISIQFILHRYSVCGVDIYTSSLTHFFGTLLCQDNVHYVLHTDCSVQNTMINIQEIFILIIKQQNNYG